MFRVLYRSGTIAPKGHVCLYNTYTNNVAGVYTTRFMVRLNYRESKQCELHKPLIL